MNLHDLLSRTLLIDLETTRSGKVRHIGAVLNGSIFEKKKHAGSKRVLTQLDQLAAKAEFVLGHNLLGHDFPILRVTAPWLNILKKPIIDTLYLSPLAFPQNPYHRLVKNYKLVRESINHPVEDAELAASVFKDQWESFRTLAEKKAVLIEFYRFCFRDSVLNSFSGKGISSVFSIIASGYFQTSDQALECFLTQTENLVCDRAVRETIPGILVKADKRPAAAYTMAWLQVAGGNSVLPPWVRYRFPDVPAIIKTLREKPCGESSCDYCSKNHDPGRSLARFFGYPSFREKPRTREGESLQREIVRSCMSDAPVLGILPTGAGKSLCYQLPALIRYWRRGALTVVISPLQALMKDQVDNLVKKTGTLFAEAVYGLQTLPERGEVFERIRLGDTAILYLSPEQLRSKGVRNILRQREIGCWVFDEAHCLSKWGHDFRPDYLYAARFIREFAKEQNMPVPPICCFTATAKTSVIDEIGSHFHQELDQDLSLFAGGVERENLSFEVIPVAEAEKLEKTHEIVGEQLNATDEPAGIIVYAATRKTTEEIRDFLNHQGAIAEAFHAGVNAKEKREIIEAFITGEVPVICATNAFGMGIDKENIRLVLHYQMPGSLENYIQEAGRAGRDLKPARCILLYDPQDGNRQFGMQTFSEVKRKEISRILRALRRKKRNQFGEIVVTSDELLRDDALAGMNRSDHEKNDTKVKAAVAWLERAGFLQRNQNLTEAFQGKPLFGTIEEAEIMMRRLNLNRYTKNRWLTILRYIINHFDAGGIRADNLAEALFPEKELMQAEERKTGLTAGQIVLIDLHRMADAGLIDQGIMLSVTFRPRGKNRALTVLEHACALENKLIRLLESEAPDADGGNWVWLNIRRLNQKLINDGEETNPDALRLLIKGISYDGKGLAASQGSFEISYIDRNRYQVKLQRSWDSIRKTIFLRQSVAHAILRTLTDLARKQAVKTGKEITGDVQLSFASNDLSAAIKSDITLIPEIKRVLPAIDRALTFLHDQKVITLQGGLAILRQAMTLRLSPSAKGRYYGKGDFKPLAVHYREKHLQVHVMMRYASMALEKIASALTLILDYFSLGRIKFINKYFEADKDLLDKATTAESYRTVVENLRNPVQISAVGKSLEDNMLILSGPGSGKTTVIVHRCAYLLEVERVPARQILVLCFNHSSAVVLKKRLGNLVGRAARGVTVATYHGAAMRLAGISIRDMAESHHKDNIDFDRIVRDAVQLIRGDREIPGMEPDEVRDRLLAGYSHILVDEYQDIDEIQYDLVSAIAGRSLEEEEGRLTIMAVGDDDQNIYTFRGANVRFIRQFQEDYLTQVVYLVENYRSSKHIITAANGLIDANRDRMKGGHPICINRERESSLPGGRWEDCDPVSKGCVQIVSVRDLSHQAGFVKSEIDRIRQIAPNTKWTEFAVLSRTKAPLAAVRAALENAGYPLRITLSKGFPLHRVREIRMTLNWLMEREKENSRASGLQAGLMEIRGELESNIWWHMIDMFWDHYRDETADSLLPVCRVIDHLFEFIAEQRREKVLGHGIFLTTIHSAKGMEFPHVFILDGDWCHPAGKARWEEERRILYVGMTRAEETLCLLKIPGRPNPFLKEIKGGCSIPLTYRGVVETGEHSGKRYELLGLNEIYLDYAGKFPAADPIHHRLAALETGQRVSFCQNNSKTEINDAEGNCLARLSAEGTSKWRNRLDRILEVRVVAMLQRDREDPDENFQKWIQAEQWELPILEVVSAGDDQSFDRNRV